MLSRHGGKVATPPSLVYVPDSHRSRSYDTLCVPVPPYPTLPRFVPDAFRATVALSCFCGAIPSVHRCLPMR